MIPVPKSGMLERVTGEEQARATPGIEDVQITARLHDSSLRGRKGRATSDLFSRAARRLLKSRRPFGSRTAF